MDWTSKNFDNNTYKILNIKKYNFMVISLFTIEFFKSGLHASVFSVAFILDQCEYFNTNSNLPFSCSQPTNILQKA